MGSLAFISAEERALTLDIQSLANRLVRLNISEPSQVLACVILRETVLQGGSKEAIISDDGVLRLQGRLCVHNVDILREKILEEAHNSRYSIHLGATKMYIDLRKHYWWRWMKKDIVKYVERCLTFYQVKYEHQKPGGLLQKMTILE
ncbi:uncharacterized protein [Nicotiana tomentosiformis]|uniref:uncharacterized protein n=1 Tax=Nicotiana tomentosiformis TaxID=4098 RepID=UPI00388CBEB7